MPLPEILVHVFPCLRDPGHLGVEELEGVDLDHGVEARHLVGVQPFPDDVVHEQDLGFGVVYEVVDVAWLEFMEDRHRNGSVGHGRQIAHRPVDLVPRADGNLVALVEEAFLEGDLELLYPPCDVSVAEAGTLVVGEGLLVPVLPEALLYELID